MPESATAESISHAVSDAEALDVFGVGTVSELMGGRQVFVNVGSREVVALAVEGKIYAIAGRCPHRSARMDHWAEVRPESCEIFCKLHAWCFSLETGEETSPWPWPDIPKEEREPLGIYRVMVRGAHVFVGVPKKSAAG